MAACDVAVIGGGPVGLALAACLQNTGLAIRILDRQPEAALADPAFDGREIALTHASQATLREIGAWELLPPEHISPLVEARVLNGGSGYALRFDTSGRPQDTLGQLVSNHAIRRALFSRALANPDVSLQAGTAIESLSTDVEGAEIRLAGGEVLRAGLVVAADSRFSSARGWLRIGAERHDFGQRMMVVRLEHTAPHHGVATEWFDYGQTIAMLPLQGRRSSAVITLPPAEMAALDTLPEEDFGPEIARRYRQRLGSMRQVSTRHLYPLVTTYAERFSTTRAALLGDAAVGMHPVTAHGFNFGLRGAASLAGLIREAVSTGQDFASPRLLRRYAAEHRQATRPLFLATNATALIYGQDTLPARLLRNAALRLGNHLPGVRRKVVSGLMEAEGH
ncbi:5-demethoxyubiquinol-8 5-hydroxylase UbiM [Pseudoroseomonas globiformis]|uniref:5-demethoxyubiquinol-8 5-hydroxylase UbiM n=1 Tax=Teichococcus globiformis TaxID=2307229 RepID=A0ABV7FUE6_9PROT